MPAGVALVVETVRVELPDPPAVKFKIVGFRTVVGPLAATGETFDATLTEPVKRLMPLRLILNNAERPGDRTETCGLAETTKSLETTVMLAMKVDQTPPVFEVYSPATHTVVVLEGSTPAPK
jgi:hypothetical protein